MFHYLVIHLKAGLKYTIIKLETLQDKDMIFLLENNIRGGISSVMSNRYVKIVMKTKKYYILMLIIYMV